jgi:hypothetical protein
MGNVIPNACLYLLERLICSTTTTTKKQKKKTKNWACIDLILLVTHFLVVLKSMDELLFILGW